MINNKGFLASMSKVLDQKRLDDQSRVLTNQVAALERQITQTTADIPVLEKIAELTSTLTDLQAQSGSILPAVTNAVSQVASSLLPVPSLATPGILQDDNTVVDQLNNLAAKNLEGLVITPKWWQKHLKWIIAGAVTLVCSIVMIVIARRRR